MGTAGHNDTASATTVRSDQWRYIPAADGTEELYS